MMLRVSEAEETLTFVMSTATRDMTESHEVDDVVTSGDDDYNPKAKDLPLSIVEKAAIAICTAIVVILMILARHQELYKTPASNKSSDSLLFMVDGLIDGWALSVETQKYASLNDEKSRGTYKLDYNGLTLSSVGIGTYLGPDSDSIDTEVKAAIYDSVMKGVNVIDTAINYRGMRSERCVGKAIRLLLSTGAILRQALFISTKAGFIPADSSNHISALRTVSEWSAAAAPYEEFPNNEIVGGSHCIAPACLNSSLLASRTNMGISTIDLFYIHNAAEKQLEAVGKEIFMQRLNASFAFLEKQRIEKTIRYYGMATWTCFTSDPSSATYLSLHEVVALAESVGGENHGFRYIQLPITITLPGAVTKHTQYKDTTLLAAAAALNVNVVSSRSIGGARFDALEEAKNLYTDCISSTGYALELENKMGKISSKHTNQNKKSHMRLSEAAKSLLYTRSVPGVLTALVGMKTTSHVHENLAVLNLPVIPSGIMTECIFARTHDSSASKKVPLALKAEASVDERKKTHHTAKHNHVRKRSGHNGR